MISLTTLVNSSIVSGIVAFASDATNRFFYETNSGTLTTLTGASAGLAVYLGIGIIERKIDEHFENIKLYEEESLFNDPRW